MVDDTVRLSYNEALILFKDIDEVEVQKGFDFFFLNNLSFQPEQNIIRTFRGNSPEIFTYLSYNLLDYFLDIRNITDEELTMFYMLHPEADNNHFHIFFEKLLTLRNETV